MESNELFIGITILYFFVLYKTKSVQFASIPAVFLIMVGLQAIADDSALNSLFVCCLLVTVFAIHISLALKAKR